MLQRFFKAIISLPSLPRQILRYVGLKERYMNLSSLVPKEKKPKVVLVATGGTGGHVIPAMCTVRNLVDNGYKVIVTCDKKFVQIEKIIKDFGLESDPLFEIHFFDINNFSRSIISRMKFAVKSVKIIFSSISLIRKKNITMAIGFGGYASFSPLLAAAILKKPIVLHEQNSVMGRVNVLLQRKALMILTTFPKTEKISQKSFDLTKPYYIGMPMRQELMNKALYEDKIDLRAKPSKKSHFNIAILGGSGGASIFSKIVPEALSRLSVDIKKRLVVTHQCRKDEVEKLAQAYKTIGIKANVQSFFHNMSELFSITDLMISRAGASTISEITLFGTPSIIVPYRLAKDNHQLKNAKFLLENGACILIEEGDFTVAKCKNMIDRLITDEALRMQIRAQAKDLVQEFAVQKIQYVADMICGEKLTGDYLLNSTPPLKNIFP